MDVNYSLGFDSRLQKECRRIFANIYTLKYWTSSEQKRIVICFHRRARTNSEFSSMYRHIARKCSLSFAMILSVYAYSVRKIYSQKICFH